MSPAQLAAVVGPYLSGEITLRGLRVYFATVEMRAVRDAARRARPGRAPRCARFRSDEVTRLTGLTETAVARELRRLKQRGLYVLGAGKIGTGALAPDAPAELAAALACKRSLSRPIPIPRAAIRFLARCSRKSVTLTLLGYLVRGLSLDRKTGEVRGRGTAKISWISRVFRLSERAAKYARAELVRLGWIGRDEGSVQRKLNRDGSYFCLNLQWGGGGSSVAPPENGAAPERSFAPLVPKTGGRIAPPNERQVNYSVGKNQKASGAPAAPAGVSPKRGGGPSLRNVSREDLEHFSRTEALYRQAVRSGMLRESEASFLNWVAAAVRAKAVEARDPVRVFMGIVRRGLWSHITGADEDRARAAINRYRASGQDAGRAHAHAGVGETGGCQNIHGSGLPTRAGDLLAAAFSTPPPRGGALPGAGRTGQGGTVGRRDPRQRVVP